jgi:hypothetical protein
MELKEISVFDWTEIWSGELLDYDDNIVFATIMLQLTEMVDGSVRQQINIWPANAICSDELVKLITAYGFNLETASWDVTGNGESEEAIGLAADPWTKN